jgi:glutamate-ammonia-ligase adenylyltransferase
MPRSCARTCCTCAADGEAQAAQGPLDVKLARGGLVDLEFIVHYLQLREHGAGPRSGPRDRGAFRRRPAAPDLRAAYDLLVRLLIVVRLVAPDGMFPPEASRCIVANACCLESGGGDWNAA